MPTVVLETIAELQAALASARLKGSTIALVPTMGALHDGHLALVDQAKTLGDIVIVSIFINPLQFGPNDDLDRYPRTLRTDRDQLAARGVGYIFAPSVSEMYPDGAVQTTVAAGRVGALYEGRSRVGHFDGVLTVVAKLLNIVRPDAVVFGQKDAQQAFLVRQMIGDLNFAVRVDVVPTVRDAAGLALSSRNRFLDAHETRAALGLSVALEAAESSADRGTDAALAAAQSVLMGQHLVELDYLKIVDPATFFPVDEGYRGRAVVLVAARIGTTRLIDNQAIYLGGNRS